MTKQMTLTFLTKLQSINEAIFLFFNQMLAASHFDHIMIFADKFGGPHVFHYHFLLIMVVAGILFYHKHSKKEELKELVILGTSSMFTLFLSIVIALVIAVNALKHYVAIDRPFCTLKNIYTIHDVIKDLACPRSFPSGHMAFSVIMVTSFWNLFNRFFKLLAILCLIIIAISRISSGAHYPADLIGAIIICLPITIFIRTKMERFIRKQEAKFKIFDKIYHSLLKK